MGSKISWILLAVIGGLVLLVSLISANLAYRGDFPVGGVSIGEIASGRDTVLVGLRGSRGTAAAWGAGASPPAACWWRTAASPRRRARGSTSWCAPTMAS